MEEGQRATPDIGKRRGNRSPEPVRVYLSAHRRPAAGGAPPQV